jgi:superfamily II DNA or RNA helicase
MSRDIIDRALASTEARDTRLVRHRYQVDAARQITSTVAKRRSCEVRLPTETGKALIAHLAALKLREQRPKSISLIIAPRKA